MKNRLWHVEAEGKSATGRFLDKVLPKAVPHLTNRQPDALMLKLLMLVHFRRTLARLNGGAATSLSRLSRQSRQISLEQRQQLCLTRAPGAFCTRHQPHFCPCIEPGLYEGDDPAAIAA